MSTNPFSEIELFDGLSFDKLLKEIYKNTKDKSKKINDLINGTGDLVKNTNDAQLIVPLLVEYIEAGIKNDDQLIKMANIIQRFVNTGSSASKEVASLLTDEEKKELLDSAKEAFEKKSETDNIRKISLG